VQVDGLYAVDGKANGHDAEATCINQSVLFSAVPDQQNCSSIDYSWDFGDGGSSSLQNPVHAFLSLGTKTVTVTATAACGNCPPTTKTDTIVVTVSDVTAVDAKANGLDALTTYVAIP
jgi:PKD repeat protein